MAVAVAQAVPLTPLPELALIAPPVGTLMQILEIIKQEIILNKATNKGTKIRIMVFSNKMQMVSK